MRLKEEVPAGRASALQRGVQRFMQALSSKSQEVYRSRFRCFAHHCGLERHRWLDGLIAWLALSGENATSKFRTWQEFLRRRYQRKIAIMFSSGYGKLTRFLQAEGLLGWRLAPLYEENLAKQASQVSPECRGLAESWITQLRDRGYARSTLTHWRSRLLQFGHFLARRATRITRATLAQAQDWSKDLRESGLRPNTVNTAINAIRNFFAWLLRTGALKRNPMLTLDYLRQKEPLPEFLEEKEVLRVLRAARSTKEKALMELLYATGLRTREIRALDVRDLSVARKTLFLRSREEGEQAIPIGRPAAKALERYIGWRERYLQRIGLTAESSLFLGLRGRRIRQRQIDDIIRAVGERAKIGKRLTATVIRHTVGSHMVNRGGDLRVVQMILGHKGLDTTAKYSRVAWAPLQDVYELSHPRR